MYNWQLIPATDNDVSSWSYGTVEDVATLYSPRTFGPKDDSRCDCGKYEGEQYADTICDLCGVRVCTDAAAARNERLGRLRLACWCDHPVTATSLDTFPIAPIAVRTNADGTPNALGVKYERLVAVNRAAVEALPSRDAYEAYYPAARDFDRTDLTTAMSAILSGADDGSQKHSLLGLITAGMAAASPHLSALIRAYGFALRVNVTM